MNNLPSALLVPFVLAFAAVPAAHAQGPSPQSPGASKSTTAKSATAALPAMRVHKMPGCGCCEIWADHVRRHGFEVSVVETANLDAIRKKLGVPVGKGSCHTGEVAGKTVEGHVPAGDIVHLLRLGDGTRGLALPGMPLGSPGMEVPGRKGPPYTVEAFDAKGKTRPFARHGEASGG